MFQQAVRVRVFQFAIVVYQGPAHVAVAACSIIMVWITGPFEELGIDSLSAAKIFFALPQTAEVLGVADLAEQVFSLHLVSSVSFLCMWSGSFPSHSSLLAPPISNTL